MESAQELQHTMTGTRSSGDAGGIQAGAWLLELSLDWIVLRASENVHHLLGQSHVTLIDEPLGRFVQAQALHDLRNLFSRLSGTTGIARAYGVRLTDEHQFVDIAFQLAGGRVLFEAVPSSGTFGEAFGTVGGLIAGLAGNRGQALLDGAARRMRALTGVDRVTVRWGEQRAESSRGAFGGPADMEVDGPVIVTDSTAQAIPIFPRSEDDDAACSALLRAPDSKALQAMEESGVRSTIRVAFRADGVDGEFRCDSRVSHPPSFEIHAAAELFAQMLALQIEIAKLRATI
jgi:light-regulated signal transduction histidine kinase (bacteriophytochrome)